MPGSRSATRCPSAGPASAYGTIGKSEAASFAMINDQGSIDGHGVRNFISRDDSYSPPKTVEVVRRLVEEDHGAVDVRDARHATQ